MKNNKLFVSIYRYKTVILSLLISWFIYSSCTEEPQLWKVDSQDQVAKDYIKSTPEFSEFAKLVEMTGMEALLGIRGPYTIMLPNHDSLFAYNKAKGI